MERRLDPQAASVTTSVAAWADIPPSDALIPRGGRKILDPDTLPKLVRYLDPSPVATSKQAPLTRISILDNFLDPQRKFRG